MDFMIVVSAIYWRIKNKMQKKVMADFEVKKNLWVF